MNSRRGPWFRHLLVRGLWLFAACRLAVGEPLTIATYNVENYGPTNRMTADGFRLAYPKPEAEKQALRRVIRALAADVLVLEEMGEPAYLAELQHDLRTDGCDYPFAALAAANDPERHVAILSRRPLHAVATLDLHFTYFGVKQQVKRGLLRASIDTDGGELAVFAFHLKSRLTERTDDPDCAIRRAAEATAIRNAVLVQFPDPASARFLLIGDCNDHRASMALQRLQHRGELVISELLPAIDSRRETWTYFYAREDAYGRVDHILISPAVREAVLEHTARIYDGPDVAAASDHRPVFVRLDLRRTSRAQSEAALAPRR